MAALPLAASKRFAVDRDDLATGDLMKGRDPIQQAGLELAWLQSGEDGVEAVVRRDAVGEVKEAREPVAAGLAEVGDGDEVVGTANHGAEGDRDNVNERMSDLASPGVGEVCEVILDACGLGARHGSSVPALAI
jgi:hypothetical protein